MASEHSSDTKLVPKNIQPPPDIISIISARKLLYKFVINLRNCPLDKSFEKNKAVSFCSDFYSLLVNFQTKYSLSLSDLKIFFTFAASWNAKKLDIKESSFLVSLTAFCKAASESLDENPSSNYVDFFTQFFLVFIDY